MGRARSAATALQVEIKRLTEREHGLRIKTDRLAEKIERLTITRNELLIVRQQLDDQIASRRTALGVLEGDDGD